MTLLWFVLLASALVITHEVGHFACARLFGVEVVRFSLGIGPRLIGVRLSHTEYVVSLIPLGGYIRLLGEHGDGEEEHPGSFSRRALWQQAAIVMAGPLMNLLLPFLLLFFVFLGDQELTPSVVGRVMPGMPAFGQLEVGDRILAVDGRPISTFQELSRWIEARPRQWIRLTVERQQRRSDISLFTESALVEEPFGIRKEVGRIGISPQSPLAVIGVPSPHSPAALAQLRTFDRIVAVGGQPIERFTDLQMALNRNRGSTIPITYFRPQPFEGIARLLQVAFYEPRMTLLLPDAGPGDGLLRAGIEATDLYVAFVAPNSLGAQAGIRPGDRLLDIDGEEIKSFDELYAVFEKKPGLVHRIRFRRGGQELSSAIWVKGEQGLTRDELRHRIGLFNWVPMSSPPPLPNPHLVIHAFREAYRTTWDLVQVTLLSLWHLLEGELPLRDVGGALLLFQETELAVEAGPMDYFVLMAIVSIHIGVLNLLPVPLLDGGQLLFLMIEALIRRPIPGHWRSAAQVMGLLVLILFAALALKNDLERYRVQANSALPDPASLKER
ncbi:MAG: site-2 protease family protein [Deltaproteobacteria bacterium]|nr:site-2 protease family protein [Deltaproteobacteria bacterium]